MIFIRCTDCSLPCRDEEKFANKFGGRAKVWYIPSYFSVVLLPCLDFLCDIGVDPKVAVKELFAELGA
jgi:hypothetical protein